MLPYGIQKYYCLTAHTSEETRPEVQLLYQGQVRPIGCHLRAAWKTENGSLFENAPDQYQLVS